MLLNREYVILDSRRFRPTDVGRAVAKFLSGHFAKYVDYDFTAKLEDELDAVSRGEEEWMPLLEKFWKPFKAQVDEKNETVDRSEATGARELGTDPKSGKPVQVRLGRYGAVRADRHQGRRRQAEVREPSRPARACTRSRCPMRSSSSSCRAISARPTTARTSRSASAASVRSSSTAATTHRCKPSDDPYTIELPRALELIRAKAEAAANRIIKDFGNGVQVLNGRYGPYITDGEKNARIPKGREPSELTAEESAGLLAAAPNRPKRGGRFGAKSAKPAKKDAAAEGRARREENAAPRRPRKRPRSKKTAARKKTAAKKATARKAPEAS